MRPDTFTLALTFTFCCVLAFKWFYFRNNSGSHIAKTRLYYEQSLDRLSEDPNNPLFLERCYQLGHQLYDRTLFSEDTKVMSQLARLRIEKDIEDKLNRSLDQAA
jgi:hypothetical protein